MPKTAFVYLIFVAIYNLYTSYFKLVYTVYTVGIHRVYSKYTPCIQAVLD